MITLIRNSTNLLITTGKGIHTCTTPIPWVSNAPSFLGFSDPTLTVLQNAWNVGKNDIQIVPDDPVIEPFLPVVEVV